MTFSEYAQMLNPYLSAGMLPDKFIISLTAQIMDESFFNENTLIEEHPLGNKDEDTLRRIYKGTKSLARKDAQIILNHLDKTRFDKYLSELSDDVMGLVSEAMLKNGITIDDDAINICTDLFVSILEDCASRKPKLKSSKKVSTIDNTKNEVVSQSSSPSYEPESECMSDNCLVEKECSKSTPPPSEQEPPASIANENATSVSDKSGSTSPNTEATGTQDETVSSDTNGTDSSIGSGGAQISIPDKYRRCVFCIYWTGNASDAYKSKTGVSGMCKLYHRVQRSTDRIDCRDYEPNEARISKQILLSQ